MAGPFFTAGEALAQSAVWNGAGGDWGTATNWTPINVPDAVGDAAVFNNSGAAQPNVDLGGGTFGPSFLSLFESTDYTISNGTLIFVDVTGSSGVDSQSSANITLNISLTEQAGHAASVVHSGTGTLTLSGVNSYTGGTTINAGVVNVQNSTALGTGAVTVASGAALEVEGVGINVGNALTLNGSGVANGGALRNISGDNVYTGPITLGSASRINSDSGILQTNGAIGGAGQTLTVGGAGIVIINGGLNTGTGSLIKNGVGGLALNSVNSFTGSVTVNAGVLQVSFPTGPVNSAIGDTSAVILNGGVINVFKNETIGSLSGAAGTGVFLYDTTTLTTGGDNTSTTHSGVISESGGAGSLVKTGTGTLTLSGNNSYTGGTQVQAGTVRIQHANALGTGQVQMSGGTTLDIGGGLFFDVPIDITGNVTFNQSGFVPSAYLDTITGTGSLVKTGNGEFELAAASNYAGSTTVNGGELRISGSIASALVTGNNAAVIEVDGGSLADTAAVVLNGTSNLTLTGSETIGSLAGAAGATVTLGASTLTTGNASNTEFGGGISGAGSLVKTGTGTLTLSGSSAAFAGNTNVNAGALLINGTHGGAATTVTVNGGGTLGGSGTIGGDVIMVGGRLSAGSSPGTLTIAGDLTQNAATIADFELGTPNVINGSDPTTGNDFVIVGGTLTLDGTINISNPGGGAVSSGYYTLYEAGAVVDNGANTAAGTDLYVITSGGPDRVNLLVQNGAQQVQLWDGGDQFGNGTVDGGAGTWDASGTNWTIPTGAINDSWRSQVGVFGGAAGGAVSVVGTQNFEGLQFSANGYGLSGGTLNMLGDVLTPAQSFVTVDGGMSAAIDSNITGAGIGLIKQGNGTLILSGTNSFNGPSNVSAGTLAVTGGAAIADIVAIGVDGGATFRVDGAETIGSVAGAGNLILNAGLTTGGNNATTAVSGTLSGAGGLTKIGTGAFTLSNGGNAGFIGDILVVNGILVGSTAGSLGAASGDIFVTGGTGLSLGGATHAKDALNVSGGAVQNGTIGVNTLVLSGTGEIAANATVNVAGAAAQSGPASTMAGTVTAATYRLDSGTISGNATASTAFDMRSGLVSGTLNGTAELVKSTAGTVTFSGANTYSGATTVAAGILRLQGGAALGNSGPVAVNGGALNIAASETIGSLSGAGGTVDIDSGQTLTVNQTAAGIFAGAFADSGTLIKTGAATLTLTGNSGAFGGSTNVNAGTLLVNGTHGAGGTTLTVNAGGVLGGTGTVGATVVSTGGAVAPGNSIGTLNVAGDITFAAGSRYEVEVDPAGPYSDLIHATGQAFLNGGSVVHIGLGGTYDPTSIYTILTADGGLNGAFADVTSDFAFLDPALGYGANDVTLTLERNDISFGDIGETRNQRATAGGVESLGFGNDVYDAVVVLDGATARAAFDQLSGEIHASLKTALIEHSRHVRDAATNRIRAEFEGVGTSAAPVLAYGPDGTYAAPAGTEGTAGWGQLFGSWGETDGDGNAAQLDRSTGGLLVGADGMLGDWRLGLLAGYSYSSFDADDRASSASSDNYHLGAYAGTQWGALAFRSGLAYTWSDLSTRRSVDFPGLSDSLEADYDAGTAQVFGELGYLANAGRIAFEPFAGLAYINLDTNGSSERGGGAALLSNGGSTNTTFSTLGVRVESGFEVGGMTAMARGMLGWRHAFGDITPLASQSFAGSDAFTVAGVPIAEDAAVIELGFDLDLTDRATLGLSYDGQFGSGAQDHSAKGNFSLKF